MLLKFAVVRLALLCIVNVFGIWMGLQVGQIDVFSAGTAYIYGLLIVDDEMSCKSALWDLHAQKVKNVYEVLKCQRRSVDLFSLLIYISKIT